MKKHHGSGYKKWREAVIKKDGYQCVICGAKENLTADHILPVSVAPVMCFAIENGRTLCEDCRKKDEKQSTENGLLSL